MINLKTVLAINFLIYNLLIASPAYITGRQFEALGDLCVGDNRSVVKKNKLTDGSIIFVKTDYLDYFFTAIRPTIKTRYILISHNSDHAAPGNFKYVLDQDPLLIMWFGQNSSISSHPKFQPIPIGIANPQWPHGDVNIFQHSQQNASTAHKLLFMPFSSPTHSEREYLRNVLKHKKMYKELPKLGLYDYLTQMSEYKFTLSPRGNGLDCHRTWEALLMGSIPIVKSSPLDELYQELPILIIQKWEDVNVEFLERKYTELHKKNYNLEKIYFEYWKNLILKIQQSAL